MKALMPRNGAAYHIPLDTTDSIFLDVSLSYNKEIVALLVMG